MPNYLLRLSFVGTNFFGWQVQPNLRTVQGEIEKALKTIFKEDIRVIGCCRTDSGVHAIDYIANFKTERDFEEEKLLNALNGILPEDIGVCEVRKVDENFNARFSVKGKVYLYKIWNAKYRNPFLHRFSWQVKKEIDIHFLEEILKKFEGTHNFEKFAKLEEEKNTVINVEKVEIKTELPLIEIRIRASHFLRFMVRRIVGTSVKTALGFFSLENLENLLNRKEGKIFTAPSKGLHLERVIL